MTRKCIAISLLVVFLFLGSMSAFGQTKKQYLAKKVPQGHDFTKVHPGASFRPNHLIVRFAPDAKGSQRPLKEKQTIMKSLGGGALRRNINVSKGSYLIELPQNLSVEEALKIYNARDDVLYAEPDYKITLCSTIPNDPEFSNLWGMHNTGQSGGTPDADIDAPEAWDIKTDASNIIVAVLDTGIDFEHEDLHDNMWTNEAELNGITGLDDDGNGYIDDIYGYDFADYDANPTDYYGHGTHCAGTIGAVGNNNKGVAGVCWNAKIMSVKIFPNYGEETFISRAVEAIHYAVRMGAKVLSNSWGGGSYSQPLKDAIDDAQEAGILFIAAAGNSGSNNDLYPIYPSSYTSENIISVMATDYNDVRSIWPEYGSSSCYGATSVDIAAPGTYILSCIPGNQYDYFDGTSMATPHVSGACALTWAANPSLYPIQVKQVILDSAQQIPSLNGLCVTGGRLNLYDAVIGSQNPKRVHNVTADLWYYNINDALGEVSSGDEIVVYPGTYNETLDLHGTPEILDITIRSVDPNDWDVVASTIIDGGGADSTVTLSWRLLGDFKGFTITGGTTGVSFNSCTGMVLSKCIVRNNARGIDCYGTHAKVTNCVIHSNTGEGICSDCADLIATSNVIYNNNEGIYLYEYGSAEVRNNTIVNNTTCGIRHGIYVNYDISHCIVWNNGNDLENCSATYTWLTSHGDPCFLPDDPFFHISKDSPCIEAGDPDYELEDGETDIDNEPRLLGCRVDIGADELFLKRVHNVTADEWFSSINDALDEVSSGDEIVVYPDTYYESLDLHGTPEILDITIRSVDPDDWDVVASTIIDGSGADSTVILSWRLLGDFTGFTITGGSAGVSFNCATEMVLSKCIVRNNDRGIDCYGTHAKVTNCVIHSNEGEGIYIDSTDLIATNNVICNNNEGIYLYEYGSAEVRNNTIVNNTAYGIRHGIYVNYDISNCIVWNNGDDLENCSASYTWLTSQGNPGFVPDDPFFHIDKNSPCVEAGNPYYEPEEGETDIDNESRLQGHRVDIGADELRKGVHNVTADLWYHDINDALDEVSSGDEIVVEPGIYNESLDLHGTPEILDITIRSVDPDDWDIVASTIIDGSGADSTVILSWRLLGDFTGFTITGGSAGVSFNCATEMVLSKCIVRNNDRGIDCYGCSAKVKNCVIHSNDDEGIYNDCAGLIATNNVIYNNNEGIHLYQYIGNAEMRNNTIVNNTAYGIWVGTYVNYDISNCIVWHNGKDLKNCSANYTWLTSHGNPGFVPDDPFFHIDKHSPCVDAGDPDFEPEDGEADIDNDWRIWGLGVDMGADESDLLDHWWKLDETSGVTAYDSIDDDDGTFNGSEPSWVNGLFDGAVNFNGVSDYFSIPTLDSAYTHLDSFCVAGWFKTSQSTGIQTIAGSWSQKRYEYYTGYYGWQVLVENNKVVARLGLTSLYDITGVTNVSDGQWHNFVLVHPQQGPPTDVFLYVDGQLDATVTYSHFYYSDSKFRIGDGSYATDYPVLKGGPFKGVIDNVIIFEGVLSEEDVEHLYENGM